MGMTRVRASNLTEIQEYAGILEDFDCYRFYPTMTEPFDVSQMNATELIPIMTAYGQGDIVELCKMKEDDEEGNRRKRLMNKRQIVRPFPTEFPIDPWTIGWTRFPLPWTRFPFPTYKPFYTYLGGYQGLEVVVRFE